MKPDWDKLTAGEYSINGHKNIILMVVDLIWMVNGLILIEGWWIVD